MLTREAVLAFQEEGAGQFEPHAHQVRPFHQHGAESSNRLVQQRVAAVFVRLRVRLLDSGHAVAEQGVEVLGSGGKERQKDQGCNETAHDGLLVRIKKNPASAKRQRRGKETGRAWNALPGNR